VAEIDEGTSALIAQLAEAAVITRTVEGGNTPFLLAPNDYKLITLDHVMQNDRSERPHRIKQAVDVWDTAGFIEYFQKFRDASSRVFADVAAATVTAILDYHEFTDSVEGQTANAPRWGSHKLTLILKKSPEWLLWTGSNKKTMDQDTFATFIEDSAPDITEPSAATMKEIASDLHETHEMTFAGTAKAANGSAKLNYSQENKSTFGKADATVPESFKIGIPVYQGGQLIPLIARLRWRVSGGKASFWYDLLRSDAAERAAFDGARTVIAEAIGIQIINGVAR
jgi:uncharacterized protein YfdQ (DUF2303 family)